MERLAAARRPQAKEVRVVRQLVLSLLSGDVDGHRHALAVGVVDFQRRFLAVLDMFLIHQAHGCVAQGQETVVVLVQGIAVAGKRGDEQFQLVIGVLADVDAHATEGILQIIGAFLYVRVGRYPYNKIEMAVQ